MERFLRSFAARHSVDLSVEDIDFAYQWTGGHPGYLAGVSRIVGNAVAAIDPRSHGKVDRFALHRGLIDQLRQDPTLHTESEKIWDSCTSDQQETLRHLFSGLEADPSRLSQLMNHHLLVQMREEPRAFCRLFAEYVLAHQTDTAAGEGIYLENESGEVTVNGRQIDLTALEYELMKLLYQNSNRILDKYQIVSGVWGEEGLREVDDARIEKLVSRLRQKVEPDAANPVYITTVRGRGYRLVTD